MSCQRILAQINNAVPSASVSASSVLPAARQIFQQQTTREGNGSVVLSGDYEGAADATFEVEIRTPATGAEMATTPVFSGAGNGTLEDLSIDPGTAAQDITVTLVDMGTATSAAQLTIYGDILLRAKTAGSAGNALVLTVTPNLTLSASPVGALSAALEKDAQDWTDQRADFVSVPLLPDGTIPATAPRIVFGGDLSRVYRHYKRWDGDQWRYGVSPKLAAAYPEGSTVHTVTGDYSVKLDNGTTPETYASITTLYGLLTALSASALVEVVGAVGNNAKPNGIAAIDLPIRTSAFALPIIVSEPDRMPDLLAVAVSADSPTETITLECTKNSPVGSESWAVRSKVAGTALPDAVTGALYTASTSVQFVVPVIPRVESPISGVISITDKNFPRATGDTVGVPAICLDRPHLGGKASSKTLKLVWTARPAADCDCSTATVSGGPSPDCLGIDIEGDDSNMAILEAGHRARLEKLTRWLKAFVAANTAMGSDGELRAAENDIALATQAAAELGGCLSDLYTTPGAVLDEESWEAGGTYLEDAVVRPAIANGYRYRATTGGVSGGSAPTWPTAIDATVADGTVIWTCVSKTAPYAWDEVLAGLDSDLSALETLSAELSGVMKNLEPSTAYTLNDVAQLSSGSAMIIRYCVCIQAGTTGASFADGVPTEIGAQFMSGSATFRVVTQAEAYARTAGGSGDINYTAKTANNPGFLFGPDEFALRYATACDEVRAIAGLSPKKSNASSGDGCWRDPGDAHYWVIEGTPYLPVFNNVYYHATVLAPNDSGVLVPTPTFEFGFGLQVACAERLQAGDSITISISDVSADYPYQIGDTYKIPIIGGGPLSFTGGVDGTDTLTWAVQASVDGALADYALDLDEDPYATGGLNFEIHRGGIPFALDDRFSFSIEAGGRFRWRKDAAAWSADTAIAASVALADGLSALFQPGAAPSFVEGDVYRYSARQPNAPDHTQSAHGETWKWSGSSATLTLAWASDQSVSMVGLLRHALTAPATVSIVLKNAASATLATLAPTVAARPILSVLDTPLTTVRSIEITVVNAGGMALGWVYAGVPFEPSHNARVTLRRAYALDRSSGLNPRGTYLGAGRGGEIAWENWLLQDEFNALLSLIDGCKTDDDAPIVFLPQVDHPSDAALARIDSDALEVSDVFDFQPGDAARRRLSLTLPLAAVLS